MQCTAYSELAHMKIIFQLDSKTSVKLLPTIQGLTAVGLFGKEMIQSEVVSEHLGLNDCRILAASKSKLVFGKHGLKKELRMDKFKCW